MSVECGSGLRSPKAGWRLRRFILGAAVAALVGLAFSSSAAAAINATLAPIGSASAGNYLVTIKNEGPNTEGPVLVELSGSEEASGLVPSTCAYNQPLAGTIGCPPMAAGATLQLCYHGPAASGIIVFYSSTRSTPVSKAGAVGSCPVAGFKPPAAGSGGFSLGEPKERTKTGTAVLPAGVPGAGALRLSGPGVKPVTANAKQAGTVNLTVKATGQKAAKLDDTGKVTVQVTVTFTPSGGKPSAESATVKLVKN